MARQTRAARTVDTKRLRKESKASVCGGNRVGQVLRRTPAIEEPFARYFRKQSRQDGGDDIHDTRIQYRVRIMAIRLAGWDGDVVEVAMSVLCAVSSLLISKGHSSPRGGATNLTAFSRKVAELDSSSSWLRARTDHWTHSQYLSLLLLLDYLDVSIAIPWAVQRLSAHIVELPAESLSTCVNVIQILPSHLLSQFLHCLDVGLLVQAGISHPIQDKAWKEESIWLPVYVRFLVDMVVASKREDCFRSYNKSSSRDLTMFPGPLQGWYDDFLSVEECTDLCDMSFWKPVWFGEALAELGRVVGFLANLSSVNRLPFSSCTESFRACNQSLCTFAFFRRLVRISANSARFKVLAKANSGAAVSQSSQDLPEAPDTGALKRVVVVSKTRLDSSGPSFATRTSVRNSRIPMTSKVPFDGESAMGLSITGIAMQRAVSVSPVSVARSAPRLLPPVSPVQRPLSHLRSAGLARPSKHESDKAKSEDVILANHHKVACSVQRIVRGAIDRAYVRKLKCLHAITASGGLVTPPGSISILVLFMCSSAVDPCVRVLSSSFVAARFTVLSFRGCALLSPDSVRTIAQQCPSLMELDVSFASLCGDEELLSLCRLRRLRRLEVVSWTKITSSGLVQFAKGLEVCDSRPPIDKENVRLSHAISTTDLPELACASLQMLNLADCTGLSSEGLSRACDALPGLLDLCLFGCLQLSDSALLGFGRLDSRIQRMNLGGLYKVTSAGLRYMFNQHPTVKMYSNPNEFGQISL